MARVGTERGRRDVTRVGTERGGRGTCRYRVMGTWRVSVESGGT